MKALAIIAIVISSLWAIGDTYNLINDKESDLLFSLFSLAVAICFLITATR